MVTNYPQQLTATAEVTRQETAGSGPDGPDGDRIGQVVCSLHGHDAVLHFEGSRVMMRCTSCGTTPQGWEITGQGPRLRYAGDARRHTAQAAPGASQERRAYAGAPEERLNASAPRCRRGG